MDLSIEADDAAVLRRVLRGLLPQLQQEAYAGESSPDTVSDWSDDERVVQTMVESLESRLSNQEQQGQLFG